MKGGREGVEGVGEKLLCSPVMCAARVAAGVTICSDSSSSVTLSSRVTRLTSSVAASPLTLLRDTLSRVTLFCVTLSRVTLLRVTLDCGVTLFCVTLVTMFSVSASSVAGGTTRLGLGAASDHTSHVRYLYTGLVLLNGQQLCTS